MKTKTQKNYLMDRKKFKERTINKEKTKKFRCKKCNSAYTYMLSDGTLVCRNCSYRTKKR